MQVCACMMIMIKGLGSGLAAHYIILLQMLSRLLMAQLTVGLHRGPDPG